MSRSRILSHLLPLVPFDGWSDFALREAARKAGLDEAAARAAFPRGAADCIDFYFAQGDAALEASFPPAVIAALRVPERIETLVLAQLAYFGPHKEALRRAIAQRALPWNAVAATQSLYASVDAIWRIAGDTATDFNFYTKRMTLAGVYGATLLFWLNDDSENYMETLAFLKRRLGNVADFGKWKKKVKEGILNLES